MSPAFTIVGFVLGAIGAVLGAVNVIRQLLATRLRLRVRCYALALIQPNNQLDSCFCVEIANLSAFPVTITKINFKPKLRRLGSMSMVDNGCLDGRPLPRRIESRDSIQVCYKNLDRAELMLRQSEYALICTACGETRKGSLHEWHKHSPEQDEAKS